MDYEVNLESFQGPLELLYQLVKKNEIEINNISLARITDQYLEYTEHFHSFDLDIATEFTVIASELIQLKADNLLPSEENEEEDQSQLVQRLKEYEKFKKISALLKKYKKRGEKIHTRPESASSLDLDDYELDLQMEITSLKKAFLQAGSGEEDEEKEKEQDNLIQEELNYIEQENLKVEDKIQEIREILENNLDKIYFYHLISDRNNKMEIVVTFLSLLELIKLKQVQVKQEKIFDDIKIVRN